MIGGILVIFRHESTCSKPILSAGLPSPNWVDINQDGTETLRAPVASLRGSCRVNWWRVSSSARIPSSCRRSSSGDPHASQSVRTSSTHTSTAIGSYGPGSPQTFQCSTLPGKTTTSVRHPATYTYVTRESPDQLLAMFDHVEGLFTHGMDFELSPIERARTRSHILLRAAADVHVGRGWSGSGATYRRALREYPPTVFTRVSVRMLVKSLLGKRGSKVVARALKTLRR